MPAIAAASFAAGPARAHYFVIMADGLTADATVPCQHRGHARVQCLCDQMEDWSRGSCCNPRWKMYLVCVVLGGGFRKAEDS